MAHEWMLHAGCHDTPVDLFFQDGRSQEHRRATAEALAICLRCNVRRDCLNYYLTEIAPTDADDIGGVWGGTTLSSRRRIREARRG